MLMPFVLLLSCSVIEDAGESPLPEARSITLPIPEKTATDNAFAIDLFKTICADENGKNVFVSPTSVSMSLSMALNGAVGETANEMLLALRANAYSTAGINDYNQTLREALLETDPSTKLAIANSIWYREGFPVKRGFLDLNRTHYDAETNELDFSKPDAPTKINDWCARNTGDKIKSIVEQIPDEAMLYLINAVYFKGVWASKFDPELTRKETFHPADGATRQVDMMRQTSNFNYSTDENVARIELPYGNKAFTMILMLPHEGKTIDNALNSLTNESLRGMLDNAQSFNVRLLLPRFKLECKYALEEKTLPAMGMKTPFSPVTADFGGISDVRLHISGVIHKTFVELNEEGTEAAAVTATEVGVTSVGPQAIDFLVDRPFLFVIMERSTGAILFTGKIENP